jgi:hypothetical protein
MKRVALLILALVSLGIAETAPNRPNSLGISEVYTNTNAYILALPLDGQVLGGEVTNIRLQPYGTPQLYDENLLLCGDVTEAFNGKSGVLVIVYSKVAHRLYQNVPCHNLKGVFETK